MVACGGCVWVCRLFCVLGVCSCCVLVVGLYMNLLLMVVWCLVDLFYVVQVLWFGLFVFD